jgi:arsenate reductase
VKTITLYHNPQCSKSRQALELLRESGVDVDVVDYQRTPLGCAALVELISASATEPVHFVRVDDASFRSSGARIDVSISAEAVAELLAEHPSWMQRPVVRCGDRVVIARPPERCLDLVDEAEE